jgi:hypothetical protein
MRIKWIVACLTIGIAAAALGCGSYSAPNSPMSPDSSGSDSMPKSPY